MKNFPRGDPWKKVREKLIIFFYVNSSVGTRDMYFVYVCIVYNIYAKYQKILRVTLLKVPLLVFFLFYLLEYFEKFCILEKKIFTISISGGDENT